MASPHRSEVVLTLSGLALGVLAGWVAGLLRGASSQDSAGVS